MQEVKEILAPIWGGYGKYIDRSVCCYELAHAFSRGTDNEGYGACASAYNSDDSTSINLGSVPSSIKYCPWCGFEVAKLDWKK